MVLRRAWMRQLRAAGGTALLAPGAVITSIMALVVAGGFAGVGTVGQILTGPALPRVRSTFRAVRDVAAPSRIPASQRVTAAAGAAAPHTPNAPGPAAGSVAQRGALARHGAAVGGPASPPHAPAGTRPGAQQPPGPPVASGRPPAPPPPRRPTPVDGLVNVGTGVTGRLPNPVGPIGTHALQTLDSVADQLVAPSPPRMAAPLTGVASP